MIKEKQVHILIGCADARDLSQVQLDAVRIVSEEYRNKGIEIEYHVVRAAGSFVTKGAFNTCHTVGCGFVGSRRSRAGRWRNSRGG